jgi:[ribosomal protein S5]-alanine N-acetyltransferase
MTYVMPDTLSTVDSTTQSRPERLTPRLRLVPVTRAAAGELWRLHWDEGIAAWHLGRYTAQLADFHADRMARSWEDDGVGKWLAYSRATGELIGRGGLSVQPIAGVPRHEVGWAVRREFWGSGYATEIGQAGLDFAAARGVTDVVAFTELHNRRSIAVMRRLGLRYEQDFRRDGFAFVCYATVAAPA